MDEKLYEALEVCLKALETGADPESVLRRFPELKEDLLPLLETSRKARMLAIAEVPQTAYRRGRARVLRHAAGMRQSSAKAQKNWAFLSFPRLAASLGLAFLFFFSGSELVRASDGALPGDHLYPVKRTFEDVRLLMVFDVESREELEDEFEQERLHEVDELLTEGRHETIDFAGVVTEQNGDLWVISGVPVQITPESRLPETPVIVGASVILQGRTNAQGFVEAVFIEVLESNVALPTGIPTEIESHEDSAGSENSSDESLEGNGPEINNEEQGDHDEDEAESSSQEAHDGEDEREDGHSGSNYNNADSDEDQDEEDRNGEDHEQENRNGNDGSRGEHDEEDK